MIAAVRPIDDRSSADLSRRLHAHFAELRSSPEIRWPLAEALRLAQREAYAAGAPEPAALRAFVP